MDEAFWKRLGIFHSVQLERMRQDEKWGEQNHPSGTGQPGSEFVADKYRKICDLNTKNDMLTWQDILTEEAFEAFAEDDPVKLKEELVQVIAVAVAWIESIERNGR